MPTAKPRVIVVAGLEGFGKFCGGISRGSSRDASGSTDARRVPHDAGTNARVKTEYKPGESLITPAVEEDTGSTTYWVRHIDGQFNLWPQPDRSNVRTALGAAAGMIGSATAGR
jgi:hypothetical protein